jgi:hypothetical protein
MKKLGAFLAVTLALGAAFAASKPAVPDGVPDRIPDNIPDNIPDHVVLFDAKSAAWVEGGGPGSLRTPVFGDPGRIGPYMHLIRVPAETTSLAHKYSDTRTYTVIAGTWYVGFGSRFDRAQLRALPAGSYYSLPAGVAVFNATGQDGATIQIGGTGPTEHIDLEAER